MATQKYNVGSLVNMQATGTSLALSAGSTVVALTNQPYDNRTNLFFWGDIDLVCTFGTAPTAGKILELYAIPSLDGTNFADGDASKTPDAGLRIGAVAVRGVNTQQRLTFRGCNLPPHKFNLVLKNGADQTISAGWTLDILPYDSQVS